MRVGVVRRFVVCADDAGESASKISSDSMGEVTDNGLTERFIREFMVLNTAKMVFG